MDQLDFYFIANGVVSEDKKCSILLVNCSATTFKLNVIETLQVIVRVKAKFKQISTDDTIDQMTAQCNSLICIISEILILSFCYLLVITIMKISKYLANVRLLYILCKRFDSKH